MLKRFALVEDVLPNGFTEFLPGDVVPLPVDTVVDPADAVGFLRLAERYEPNRHEGAGNSQGIHALAVVLI